MTRDEQIAALTQQLAILDATISHLQEQRKNSIHADERASFDAQIASSQETRQAVQNALNNLSATADALPMAAGITPAAARRVVAASGKAHIKDMRTLTASANKRAKAVLKLVKVPKTKTAAAKNS